MLISLIMVAGCTRNASELKEREFARQRADYLALKNPRDQRAIEAFDRFFEAERFQHDYWIHLTSGKTNHFWWGTVQDSPKFERYTVYMIPLGSVPLDRDTVYHIRPRPPVTKESVTEALQEGYTDLRGSTPIAEFKDSPAVVASHEGETGGDRLFITLIVDFHGKLFAVAVMMQKEHRGEVIKHLAELLETVK